MRPDMSKVIVERPRWGSRMKSVRRFRRLDPARVPLDEDAFDPYPNRIGHHAGAVLRKRRKVLNENLAPLRRFLVAQVGRPWDAVWSEISEHLKPTSTVQQHVRDHVEDFVAVRTRREADAIWFTREHGPPCTLSAPRASHVLLYVDPDTGILCANPHAMRWARRRRLEQAAAEAARVGRLKRLGPKHVLVLLDDGNWWEVRLAATPWTPGHALADGGSIRPPKDLVDVIDRAALSTLARSERYGGHDLYAIAKRPLSKRELKKYKLR